MAEDEAPLDERRRVYRHALLAGPDRALGLRKRVPELLRERGWPESPDLVNVLCAALALHSMGRATSPLAVDAAWSGSQLVSERVYFRAPPGAEHCGGKWPPGERLTAGQVVDKLELQDLLG